jgi:hypothetical protein
MFKSVDGMATWASLGIVPNTSSDAQVAPTLDKFYKDGKWFVVLGYCNRGSDTMVWRLALVDELISSADAFSGVISVGTDLDNASGYQSVVTNPLTGDVYIEGGFAYIEFKEYTGFDYSQVRYVIIDLLDLAFQSTKGFTVASGVITVNSAFYSKQIAVDTEGAAATDDLDTINGGFEGQEITVRSSTAARDTILKCLTGNLYIRSDF